MAYLLSYRHTDADPEQLKQLLPAVWDAFTSINEPVYSTYFENAEFRASHTAPKDVLMHAFNKIDELQGLFVIQDSEERSEGMLMEIGYCMAKNYPICVATRRGVHDTYLPTMVSNHFYYETIDDLTEKIRAGEYK